MRGRAATLALALLALVAWGCAGAAAGKSRAAGPSGPSCAGSTTSCLTAPECTYDEGKACTMCRCGPATVGPPDGMVNAEGIPPVR